MASHISRRWIIWFGVALQFAGSFSLPVGASDGLSVGASEPEAANSAVCPEQPINLFNGRDLTGLYTWQSDNRRNDPRRVYAVQDQILRISGEGLGYVATRSAYRDYRLVVEYKWGTRTNSRGQVRNSGILLHATGEDGNYKRLWMTSIECQLAQGCEGDLIIIQGSDPNGRLMRASVTADTVAGPDGNTRWSPDGKRTVCRGHQLWWSKHDPEFKELLDTRGQWDVASPLDQWTRVECSCSGDRISVHVNGVLVNVAYDVVPAAGKILLQNEGHEIMFRKFEIHPLPKDKTDEQINQR